MKVLILLLFACTAAASPVRITHDHGTWTVIVKTKSGTKALGPFTRKEDAKRIADREKHNLKKGIQ